MSNPVKNGQTIHSLTYSYTEGSGSLSLVPDLLKKVLLGKMWEGFVVESNDRNASFETFQEFVIAPVPEGMGTTIEDVKRICSHRNDVITLIDEELKRPIGGLNNPTGVNQYTFKENNQPKVSVVEVNESNINEEENEECDQYEVNLYNVQDDQNEKLKTHNAPVEQTKAPTGNTKAAGLRRLRKDRPDLHEAVVNDEISVNEACVRAGFRKRPTPVDQAKKAVEKMNNKELEEFKSWFKQFANDDVIIP